MMRDFTHGSLFSGIGGFDLAAEWMGWENIFHCEINPFCKRLLKYYWPHAQSFDDIKTTDFTIYNGKLDILTGGFPCQPYSQAGKRKGKEDERHLWPEMFRAIREIRPRWIVGENVFGLINWNGGLVFDEVQADLEAAGYEVWAYVLPACSVNAPHRRDRIWFVAHSESSRSGRWPGTGDKQQDNEAVRSGIFCEAAGYGLQQFVTHSGSEQCAIPVQQRDKGQEDADTYRCCKGGVITYACGIGSGKSVGGKQSEQLDKNGEERGIDAHTSGERWWQFHDGSKSNREGHGSGSGIENWSNWPTQSPVCNGNDGISSRLDFAAVFGNVKHSRQPARAFGKWRNESIKGAGNAIVPPLVYQFYKTIEAYEKSL